MPYRAEARQRLAVERDGKTGLPKNAYVDTCCEEESHRPPFAHDSDRLIDTAGFRRLQGKMQVVSPGQGDFFRTRLTHTIEVSRLARSMAYKIGTDHSVDGTVDRESSMQTALICEAAGIAHDFGHPPFGHGGERALNKALDDVASDWGLDPYVVGGFEGNAQTFRQLVWSFSRTSNQPGLHLTRAVLDATLKYPWRRSSWLGDMEGKGDKWSYYPTESWAFDWVRRDVLGDHARKKCYEASIMDWADDVAYATHDLEDWFRAGRIPLGVLHHSPEARRSLAERLAQGASDTAAELDKIEPILTYLFEESGYFAPFNGFTGAYDGSGSAKDAIRQTRRKLFRFLINGLHAEGEVWAGGHAARLIVPQDAEQVAGMIKRMARAYVIDSPNMATYEYGQGKIVEFLVKTYTDIARAGSQSSINAMPVGERDLISKLHRVGNEQGECEILRRIADYIAGMTDAYAAMMYSRLNGGENIGYHMYF